MSTHRGRRVLIGVLALMVVGAAATGAWLLLRETDDDRYVAALTRGGFSEEFATPEVAIASGHAYCDSLSAGAETEGFDHQKVAVTELCPQFEDAFTVIPTPEQQAAEYTSSLRDEGLDKRFASDAAAVAHAQATCRSLEDGAAQQGSEVDEIAVSVYCPDYASGFETLHPIKVKGTFTLFERDPSEYFPSIDGTDNNCSGAGGYGDITEGREVLVTGSSGKVLTTTTLGQGTGMPPYQCEFPFKFTVMDGQTGYRIEVGSRGSLHYTAADLKVPGSVAVRLGD